MRSRIIMVGIGLTLILTNLVQPFTYVANVLGAYYVFTGGYDYDPRSPFVNHFASGDPPEVTLRPQLERLIGATGLDPLDAASPLAAYEFLHTDLPGRNGFGAWVKVRMTYADGSQRIYDVPTTHRRNYFDSWQFTGLDRLFAEHLPWGDIPLGTDTDPVRFTKVERLDIARAAHHLGSDVMSSWMGGSMGRGDPLPLRWSPKGDAFLANWAAPPPYNPMAGSELWLVPLDGSEPIRIGTNVAEFRFTPDGERILFSLRNRDLGSEIVSVDRSGGDKRVLAATDDAGGMFDVVHDSLVYADRGAVWRQSLSSPEREPASLLTLSGARSESGLYQLAFRLSPDGGRLAFAERTHLAVVDLADGVENGLEVEPLVFTPSGDGPPPPDRSKLPMRREVPRTWTVAWRPDGKQVALAWSTAWERADAELLLTTQDGALLWRKVVSRAGGHMDEPQWTPDGRWIFLPTFPSGGRRIIAVEAETGRAYDLSQYRWDAFFSLSPSGRELLLSNGRGGYWKATLDFE